ncbi:MAG: FtsX-like permease family protein [Anaerolineae bacterium]|nr:FtsX-like permease family protein [Anaerolineae bacterium]
MKPAYPPVLWQFGWRYLLKNRWQSILMLFGIALGVAVVIAIDLANASASRAFEISSEAVSGKATHQISASALGLDESLYIDLRRQGIVDTATPVITEFLSIPQFGDQPIQLLGVDPFTDSAFRDFIGSANGELPLGQLVSFITQPGTVLISTGLAERYGVAIGDRLDVAAGGLESTVVVAGLLIPADDISARALDGMMLADISTAQELTGRIGKLDRIDLILTPNQVESVRAQLPPGVSLETANARQGAVEEMTQAFRMNLSALSMLALIVGLFLIYNTMTFAVVQRRPLFGILRCLGVTRREIFMMIMSEALIIGVIGSLIGTGLGVLLGSQTVRMVSQTINDLYFATTVQTTGVAVSSLVKGGVLGILATLMAAALPAIEAAATPPWQVLSRSGLERKARTLVDRLGIMGAVAILIGVVLLFLPVDNLWVGFGATFFVVVGFAMLSALGMAILLTAFVPVGQKLFGLLGRIAPRSLVNSLSRTSVAVAALMVAVSVTIGMTLMIDSFRYTVNIWLREVLTGDVYISVPTLNGTTPLAPIDSSVLPVLETLPGVRQVDTLRSVRVDTRAGIVTLSASNNPGIGQERMFLERYTGQENLWAELQAGGVLISEPLARRMDLVGPGNSIEVFTPKGWMTFPVIGIYYDYATSEGIILTASSVYQRIWQDDQVTSIGLILEEDIDPDLVVRSLQDVHLTDQRLLIRSNQSLRSDVLDIFERTFAITSAMRILATIVAFIGILNSLLLLQLDHQREYGILRALGMTGKQIWRLVMLETGLMGIFAGLFAIPAGYVVALILIYVINQRSFGWTIQMNLTPAVLIQAMGISLVAALLAGIYPAIHLSRTPAAEVIRYE